MFRHVGIVVNDLGKMIWFYQDVIGLEITLLIILIVLCQIPIVVVSIYTNEKDANLFPEVWRILSLIILSSIIPP